MPETKQATTSAAPIEIRIQMSRQVLHLVAYRTDNGLVGYSLTVNGHGIPNSLSTLQSKAAFPGKATDGWQAEVLAFANAGLGTVIEVR